MTATQPARVLIIEDHEPLRSALARAARDWGADVLEAGSVCEAEALLPRLPDLMIVDVALPDGSAQQIVEQAVRLRPCPAVIAMSGQASAEEGFRLARAGASDYLAKPISLEELLQSVRRVLSDRPDLAPFVAAHVGKTPLRELIDDVRRVMMEQALARADGSRSGAARLLDVSRQAVQQAARDLAPVESKREPPERS